MDQTTLDGIPELTEGPRGCGTRKPGGLYLMSHPEALRPCGKLPHHLSTCPTCSAGVKHTRGWTWINPSELLKPKFGTCAIDRRGGGCHGCPLGDGPDPLTEEIIAGTKAGLLWIGKQFYPTPTDYMAEVRRMGFSRRINTVPRDFEVGKTWIFLAHVEGIRIDCDCTIDPLTNPEFNPECELCEGHGSYLAPAIFTAFRPTQVQYVITGNESDADIINLRERGITPVRVNEVEEETEGDPVVPDYNSDDERNDPSFDDDEPENHDDLFYGEK